MHPCRSFSRFLLVVCVVALGATGCGLKGPLYLPDEKAELVESTKSSNPAKPDPRRRVPAPQSQKKDRETQNPPPTDSPQPALPDPDRPVDPVTPPAADR